MITLEELAADNGIALSFRDMHGDVHRTSPETLQRILAALGIDVASSEAALPDVLTNKDGTGRRGASGSGRCFMPDWLDRGRVWGIAAQLYQLRSSRNWGVGDFGDLAQLVELTASCGGDFVGLNPLHALFGADPNSASPFSPSNRRFLNPIYIAVDLVPGIDECEIDVDALRRVRTTDFVDYRTVARLKHAALRMAWQRWPETAPATGPYASTAFDSFRSAEGSALQQHALFETLSALLTRDGKGARWQDWPKELQTPESDAAAAVAVAHNGEVNFQAWLQWLANVQLGEAQRRARAAGMRIGLYLDLAVGEDPGGSAVWTNPRLSVPGLEIGAPPDLFNPAGQKWGIVPLSAHALREASFVPYRDLMSCVMRHAGALRIDHAMGVRQLYIIPKGAATREGAYLSMPMGNLVSVLSKCSQRLGVIVIGEDLGTVPVGFRAAVSRYEIQSYRVFYFERDNRGLRPTSRYPRRALTCLSTHDLATLAGWWEENDIDLRREFSFIDKAVEADQRHERESDKSDLLMRLRRAKRLAASAASTQVLNAETAAAVHAYVAAAPSRLFAVRLEDLGGERDPVNVPGTSDEYPNWRRKLSLSLDAMGGSKMFARIAEAVAAERPKRP